MKKPTKLDMKRLAKEIGTKLQKTDKVDSVFIKYRGPKVNGIVYEDGSGGLNLKVPGLDCFISHGRVIEQVEELEKTIAAYNALKPDLKRLKRALKQSEHVIPKKEPSHAKRRVSKNSKV